MLMPNCTALPRLRDGFHSRGFADKVRRVDRGGVERIFVDVVVHVRVRAEVLRLVGFLSSTTTTTPLCIMSSGFPLLTNISQRS